MNQPASEATWRGVQTIAQREAALLAPFAMHSADSLGRKHPEPEHPYRGPFQRDRDRVLHSAAYRRLSGKMQVFTGDRGDYHRTRLTHTLEVASIARTIGRALRLNEDLIEALALLHDIGHPPFGHAGEEALDACLADEGGFSHNRHALTIVEQLEQRYGAHAGLNLTHEVLQGQAARAEKRPGPPHPLLEVQVVDAADSITYDAHDTDDAVKLGLVTLERMCELPLVRDALDRVHDALGPLAGKRLRKAVVHELIDRQVTHLLAHCGPRLDRAGWSGPDAARQSSLTIGPSPEVAAQKAELEAFLYEHVYRHADLVRVRQQATARLRRMFDGFVARAELLPARFAQRAGDRGLRRTVADYLAGMTDRYCEQVYQQHWA